MTQKKKRAQSPQRPLDLETLKAFWDFMSQHFPGLFIDLSLFNYKAGQFNKPVVGKDDYARKKKVPVEEAYEAVLELLTEYHEGKDILWKPSDYYKEHRDELVSLVWLDDFKLDQSLGLTPLLYLQTSLGKYQAIFKLSEPATVDDVDAVQKAMAKILGLGDKSAGSFFHHRRMAGLANGKYEDDPLVIFTVPETPSPISIRDFQTPMRKEEEGVAETSAVDAKGQEGQRTQRRYVKPVVPADYRPVFYRPRDEFIKRREDGTIDESATDMAWATFYARWMTRYGWDDAAIAFTIFDLLAKESPEVERRKKTKSHTLDYLFRTVWRAIDIVRRTPDKNKPEEDKKPEETDDILDEVKKHF
jgi:hypothetical protein